MRSRDSNQKCTSVGRRLSRHCGTPFWDEYNGGDGIAALPWLAHCKRSSSGFRGAVVASLTVRLSRSRLRFAPAPFRQKFDSCIPSFPAPLNLVGCRRTRLPAPAGRSPIHVAGFSSAMTNRKLQPSGDHVLIQFSDGALTASAPIARPASAKIIAIGPECVAATGASRRGLKVGEQVFVDRARGVRIRLKQQSYTVVRQRDLIAAAG